MEADFNPLKNLERTSYYLLYNVCIICTTLGWILDLSFFTPNL